MAPESLIVLFPKEEESWSAFAKRLSETEGQVIAMLSGSEETLFPKKEDREGFLKECVKIRSRLRIATKLKPLAMATRRSGVRVVDGTRELREILKDHTSAEEAIRLFSPHVWRQELRSRLQSMGLLSLPKIRIWILIAVSAGLFLFVFFRLLPSAEIRIWPRQDNVNQTAIIEKSITFDQISKEFIGKSAEALITIINKSNERYSLRTGTRLMNQAGMIFKTLEPINISAGDELTIRTRAENLDIYGEIIGARANVPAGIKWEFPGLAPEERTLIYGENRADVKGGTTSYRTVLSQADVDLAKKKLEHELL